MDFSHIADLIHHATGLTPEAIGPECLARAVQVRMAACGIGEAGAYSGFVTHSTRELAELIETLLETSRPFFQELQSFEALRRYLQTDWLQGPARVLNVLCLPCGGGEEAYSLAMSILEAGVPRQLYRIDAVEVSARNLDRARHGIYPDPSLEPVPEAWRARYFRPVRQGHAATPLLRERIRFIEAGLLNNTLGAPPGHYHLVFCRNLLHYFDAVTRRRALETLHALLARDGLLVVADSERTLANVEGFRPIDGSGLPVLVRQPHQRRHEPDPPASCSA